MNTPLNLSDLIKESTEKKEVQQETVQRVAVQPDKFGRIYATGGRKRAVARVWIKKNGSGKVTVNKLDAKEYFDMDSYINDLLTPFNVTETAGQFDVICTVKGGGKSGQAGAIRLGISKALRMLNPDFTSTLRSLNLLTRDSRKKESKKYGKKKARKSFQFSKR